MFEQLWEFSSYLVSKGIKILAVSKEENMLDVNIKRVEDEDKEHIFVRSTADGKPENIQQTIDGITYKAIKVADKIYIPDNTKII